MTVIDFLFLTPFYLENDDPLAELFEELDADEDGVLSFEEFTSSFDSLDE